MTSSSPPEPVTNTAIRPKIGLLSAIVFVISSVVGTGVFKKVVPMSAELGSPTLVLAAWLIAGLVSLAGTLSNAEVASMLASEGGEYVYFRVIYNRFFAFLFGWTNFAVIRTAAIASIAYVFAQSVNSLVPLPITPAAWAEVSFLGIHPLANISVKLLAIALVWGQTAFNIRGLRTGEAISRILTAIMVAVMLGFVVFGLTSSAGSVANLQPVDTGLSGSSFFSAMALACLSAFWPYEGWSSVGYIGGEIERPSRNLPWALTVGTLAIMALYLLMNLVYLYVVPVGELAKLNTNSIAAVTVAGRFAGPVGSLLISCLLLVTTFNCCSISILMASRLFYAMAKDGQFFSRINYMHPNFPDALPLTGATGRLDHPDGALRLVRYADRYAHFRRLYLLRGYHRGGVCAPSPHAQCRTALSGDRLPSSACLVYRFLRLSGHQHLTKPPAGSPRGPWSDGNGGTLLLLLEPQEDRINTRSFFLNYLKTPFTRRRFFTLKRGFRSLYVCLVNGSSY